MIQTTFIPQGWECPKCKRVYSPTTSMCSHCPVQGVTTTGTTLTFNSGTTFSHTFSSNTPNPTAKTKCSVCGLEQWQHPNVSYT
jgi:hypothetical protein